jgi:hypothetical protein
MQPYKVTLVGFLPNDNGRSCALHPFGCGNALVLEKDELHGVGMLIRLRLVDVSHLAGYEVMPDGSDAFLARTGGYFKVEVNKTNKKIGPHVNFTSFEAVKMVSWNIY